MIEIEKPRIECIETPTDSSYGKYIVEPLERGYGTTLGNSLRRVLLSSLPGTAATSIKIAGVQHEFSTIPGVKEDVTEIVLNVKSIIARLHTLLNALLALLHHLDTKGCICQYDILLGRKCSVFKYGVKDVLCLLFSSSTSHLFRFGCLET